MTRRKQRWRYSPVIKDAETRLKARYTRPWRTVGVENAPREVAYNLTGYSTDRLRDQLEIPAPTVADVMDGLTLVNAAREDFLFHLSCAELDLIEAAQQAGQPWGVIGEALGYAPAGAAVSAKARYRALLAKAPYHKPPVFTADPDTGVLTSADAATTAESPATGR